MLYSEIKSTVTFSKACQYTSSTMNYQFNKRKASSSSPCAWRENFQKN